MVTRRDCDVRAEGMELGRKAFPDAAEAGNKDGRIPDGDGHRLQREKKRAFGGERGIFDGESGILQDIIIECVRSLQERFEGTKAASKDDSAFRQEAQKVRGDEIRETCDRAGGDGGGGQTDRVYLRDGLFQRRSSVLELRDGEVSADAAEDL